MQRRKEQRNHRWQRVLALTANTAGYITFETLTGVPYTRHEIAHLVRLGYLESMGRNVYRLAGQPSSWQSKLHNQSIGTELVVSVLSSAMLLGLGRPADISPGYAEFLSPRKVRPRIDAVRIHVVSDFDELPVVEVGGLRVTSVDRTLVEIAARHSLPSFERCYRAAIRGRLITHSAFAEAVARDGRSRGRVALRRALDAVGGELVAPSDWSHWAKERLVDWGLPEPELEVELVDARGRRIGRVDLYWPALGLVVELDGRAFHLDVESFERDRRRDARLLGIGISVIRFTWDQYNDGRYFERTVADALAVRGRDAQSAGNSRRTER